MLQLLACASVPVVTSASAPETQRDVPYGDGELEELDLYLPAGGSDRLVVFVHGGSWVSGDKGNLSAAPDLVPWWHGRGWAVAAPNFRLASPVGDEQTVTWREQVADLEAAVGWLRSELGPREVLLLGFSSGAHLVTLVDDAELAGVVSLDVHAYDVPLALELMAGTEIEPNTQLITWLFGEDEAQQLEGSSIAWVDAGSPPALVVSADPDEPGTKGAVARAASEAWAAHRDGLGLVTVHEHFDEVSHSGLVMGFGVAGHGPTEAVEDFLRQLDQLLLKVEPAPPSEACWHRDS